MIHEDDRSWAVTYCTTNIEQQQDHEFIYRIRTKDGLIRWLRDIVKVITKGGKPVKLIGLMLEITSIKETEEKLERSLLDKEILIQEIHHRVKNNMQIISSLLELQSSEISNEEVRRCFQESQNRIHAMSLVHERLYKDDTFEEADMKEYVDSLISYLHSTLASGRNIRFETDIERVRFGLDAVIPCGLILNELVTNSLKHAFSDGKGGIISVTLNIPPGSGAELTVADNGRGLPEGYDPHGGDTLGMNLVRALVKQLEGTLEIERTPLLQFMIRFPIVCSASALRP